MSGASTSAATRWVEYTTAGAGNGRLALASADYNLEAAYGCPPVGVICQTAGLVVVDDGGGTERAFTAVAGVLYPLQGMTILDGANTTADNLLFLYNDSGATG